MISAFTKSTQKNTLNISLMMCVHVRFESSQFRHTFTEIIKADICAILLANETSTATFPRCLQTAWPTLQELTSILSFKRRRWRRNFSQNRNIQGKQNAY